MFNITNHKTNALKKNDNSLEELQDNMKCKTINIIATSEGEEKDQGIENLFEKIIACVLQTMIVLLPPFQLGCFFFFFLSNHFD